MGNLSGKDVADEVIEVDDGNHIDCTDEVQINDKASTAYTDEVDRNVMKVLPSGKSEARTYENDETWVAKFDKNHSAVENLQTLTSSLDLIQRNHSYYTLYLIQSYTIDIQCV